MSQKKPHPKLICFPLPTLTPNFQTPYIVIPISVMANLFSVAHSSLLSYFTTNLSANLDSSTIRILTTSQFLKSYYTGLRHNFLSLAGWLSGLSAGLWTTGSFVRFPVRAHALATGQIPGGGRVRGNHTLIFLSSFFLPSAMSKSKINKIFKKRHNFL